MQEDSFAPPGGLWLQIASARIPAGALGHRHAMMMHPGIAVAAGALSRGMMLRAQRYLHVDILKLRGVPLATPRDAPIQYIRPAVRRCLVPRVDDHKSIASHPHGVTSFWGSTTTATDSRMGGTTRRPYLQQCPPGGGCGSTPLLRGLPVRAASPITTEKERKEILFLHSSFHLLPKDQERALDESPSCTSILTPTSYVNNQGLRVVRGRQCVRERKDDGMPKGSCQ
mmetsp:Transcript_23948/g.95029  ORF Transcript_23948/g.95029 Transcript_23948/m.95029 type:complete len:227 (+) Transcript_23948:43-723(+)